MSDIHIKPDYIDNKTWLEKFALLKRVMNEEPRYDTNSRGELVEIPAVKTKPAPEAKAKIERTYEHYRKLCDMEGVTLQDHQIEAMNSGVAIIQKYGFAYLGMQVRTGKTYTAMAIAEKIGAKNVLFITKKNAMVGDNGVKSQYETMTPGYHMEVVNYESVHHVMDNCKWDVVILDEAHSLGAYPKPSNRAKIVYDIIQKHKPKVILLSGTPTPESYSQMYHQVYGIPGNPFAEFKNFYRFCDKYVKVTNKMINGMAIKNYDGGLPSILDAMKPYMVSVTQEDAGFATKINEQIMFVEMEPRTYQMINKLKKELVIQGKDETILADTPVKLMSKVHQLCSGTIKFESGNSMVLDYSKARFIKEQFAGKKIGIFYKFKEEWNALKEVFGDNLTDDIVEFDATDKYIALQIQSGREGVSLKSADCLVFYNIDFSATSYWQGRDRMTTRTREHNDVFWVFALGGIEKDIYDVVLKKKNYTVNHFKKTI